MRANQRTLLGIDLSPRQIRVVEMQGRASTIKTLRAGTAPMPAGAFIGGMISDPDAVGNALRRLIDGMGAGAREAVFGLSSGSVTTQIMNVPRVPNSELPMLLEGELEHYKIGRVGEVAFDYARLAGPAEQANGVDVGETPMLLMATDKSVVNAYRTVAERAGLHLLALEPTLLAMYRIGWLLSRDQPGTVCLSVDHSKSEVAVMEAGAVHLYRRVEVGGDSLFPSESGEAGQNAGSPPRSRSSILGEDNEDDGLPMPPLMRGMQAAGETGADPAMNLSAARALALELRRSLEYYRRENPNSSAVVQAVLIIDAPNAVSFQNWLMGELEMDVRLARPSEILALGALPPPYHAAPDALTASPYAELAFAPALGLGLGLLSEHSASVPHFDLSSEETANAAADAARRVLTYSLIASLLLIFVGAGVTFAIGSQANEIAHEVAHLKVDLAERQQRQQIVINRLQAQQQQLATLQKKGFPFPRLMDAVSDMLAPDIGLTEVDLDKAGKMTIMGDSANDGAIVQTLNGLRAVNWFETPSLESFNRKPATNIAPAVVQFKITTQLAGMTPPVAATGGNP